MFATFFRRRKASTCKKLIGRVQCRLTILNNRRSSIACHMRDHVASLILSGEHEQALDRARRLYIDLTLVSVYELLYKYCDRVLLHLSCVLESKDIPDDVNTAVSSLIFASARCGDVHELVCVRKLFRDIYGHRFTTASVELLPGNLVNNQLKEKLSKKTVPEDLVQKLFDEIAIDCYKEPHLPETEFASQLQNQEQELVKNDEKSDLQQTKDESSNMHSNSSSITRRYSTDSPVYDNYEDEEYGDVSIASSSSCLSLDQFPEEKLIYLDDIDQELTETRVDFCESVGNMSWRPETEEQSTISDVGLAVSEVFTFPESEHFVTALTSTRHVHPKLPDCDHIAAKFTALKMAYCS